MNKKNDYGHQNHQYLYSKAFIKNIIIIASFGSLKREAA